jgi:tripartite-type tricarboxylate transporter receptor subunit TctC
MEMLKIRFVIGMLAFALLVPAAGAADWPARPIHFIVPFPPGGSTDVAARVVGDYVSHALGQQVVVENKSGANGNIGMEYVAKSATDGYTVLIGTDAISGNPLIYKMDFDPARDLVPVVELSTQPMALAAHPSLGVTTLAELTAKAKQQPGMRFATGSGVGSQQAIVALWYAQLAGISLVQVPYRGGGEAIHDLIAGNVQLGSLGTTPLIPYYKAGTLKLLAQSTATFAGFAGRAHVPGGGLEGARARSMDGRVRSRRHLAGHHQAAEYGGKCGACRRQRPQKFSPTSAGSGWRHSRAI